MSGSNDRPIDSTKLRRAWAIVFPKDPHTMPELYFSRDEASNRLAHNRSVWPSMWREAKVKRVEVRWER